MNTPVYQDPLSAEFVPATAPRHKTKIPLAAVRFPCNCHWRSDEAYADGGSRFATLPNGWTFCSNHSKQDHPQHDDIPVDE